jgi:threonine dehydrogenase-like Zn-dependent dehydrogenase
VIASGRVDLTSMVTHRFKLDDIGAAYDPIAIHPADSRRASGLGRRD